MTDPLKIFQTIDHLVAELQAAKSILENPEDELGRRLELTRLREENYRLREKNRQLTAENQQLREAAEQAKLEKAIYPNHNAPDLLVRTLEAAQRRIRFLEDQLKRIKELNNNILNLLPIATRNDDLHEKWIEDIEDYLNEIHCLVNASGV